MKLPGLAAVGLGGWGDDPLWGRVYDWTVENPGPGRLLWKAGIGSDLTLLYDAAKEIAGQPPGASVLDVPVGGGVALRALRRGQGVRYVAADISQLMLDRTMRLARAHGVAGQVEPVVADVGDLPFGDGEFDLVVCFTGLHCFPDPHAAVVEMTRVLHPGGVLTGSTLLEDAGLRYLPMRVGGKAAGLLGPGVTSVDVRTWLTQQGLTEITLEVSGAMGYFRAVAGRLSGRRPPGSG